MKKLITALALIAGLGLISTAPASAESAGKEITIKGKGLCAKCALSETKTCQTAVQVEKNGKTTTYYLVDNATSKDFHSAICKEAKEISVTGTCKKVDGQLQVTASKIEAVK